jgi:hypothetical protein
VSHRPGFGAACQTARQMCHDPDSRPPEPPSDLHPCRPDSEVVAGALRARARLARRQPFQGIRRAGRGALRDRRCHPARHPGPHRLLRAAGEGFAAAGVDAIAIDYFGRQNRVRTPPPGFDPMVAFATITADDVSLDAAAAADHLRATGRANDRIFIVGFCVGPDRVPQRDSGPADPGRRDGRLLRRPAALAPRDAVARGLGRHHARADPRAVRRGRRGGPRRAGGRVRPCPRVSRRRPRVRGLSGGDARVLRPVVPAVRCGIRGRLAAGDRVHRSTSLSGRLAAPSTARSWSWLPRS